MWYMGDKKNSTDGTDIWPLFFNSTLYHQVDRGTTSLGSILFTLFYLFHLFQEYIRVYNDKDDTYRWLSAKENGTEASVPHLCHICTTNPIHLTYTMDTHKKSGIAMNKESLTLRISQLVECVIRAFPVKYRGLDHSPEYAPYPCTLVL